MTSDEKKMVLDAVDRAEQEAITAAQNQPPDLAAEPIIYRMAARVREAVRALEEAPRDS